MWLGCLTEYRDDAMGSLRVVSLSDGGRILYHVDGLHRRVEKEVRDANDDQVYRERYTYQDQLEPVAMQRWDADDDLVATRYFVYGLVPHVPAYMVDEQGERYAFVVDQVGSVRQVVQVSTGQVVHSMRYTAFGEVLEDAYTGGFAPQPFGYAGGLYDRETGFVRFGARDYDAFTRRWTAKDPIRFEGGDTNLFGYVGNNPVEAVDPTGLWPSYDVSVGAFASFLGYYDQTIRSGSTSRDRYGHSTESSPSAHWNTASAMRSSYANANSDRDLGRDAAYQALVANEHYWVARVLRDSMGEKGAVSAGVAYDHLKLKGSVPKAGDLPMSPVDNLSSLCKFLHPCSVSEAGCRVRA